MGKNASKEAGSARRPADRRQRSGPADAEAGRHSVATILGLVEKSLQLRSINFTRTGDLITAIFTRGSNNNKAFAFFTVQENTRRLAVIFKLGGHEASVPPSQRAAVAELLTRANYGLHLCTWSMDTNDGEVRLMASAETTGLERVGTLDAAFGHAYDACTVVFWTYAAAIRDCSAGRVGCVRDAVRACESPGGYSSSPRAAARGSGAGAGAGAGAGGPPAGVRTLLAGAVAALAGGGPAGSDTVMRVVGDVDLDEVGGGIGEHELELVRSRRIGKGGQGEVYLGALHGAPVAVKVLPTAGQTLAQIRSFVAEIRIHARLKHPNVVEVYGVCRKDGQLLQVVQLCQNKSLDCVLSSDNFADFAASHDNRVRLAMETASGMAYLHGRDVLHLDLKPQNLLVTDSMHIKVCDFGLAMAQPASRTHIEGFCSGTPLYMAPEVLKSGHASKAADVYAYGLILYELFTGRQPFDTAPRAGFFERVKSGLRPEIPDDMHAGAADLARRCWAPDPASRPTFAEVQASLTNL